MCVCLCLCFCFCVFLFLFLFCSLLVHDCKSKIRLTNIYWHQPQTTHTNKQLKMSFTIQNLVSAEDAFEEVCWRLSLASRLFMRSVTSEIVVGVGRFGSKLSHELSWLYIFCGLVLSGVTSSKPCFGFPCSTRFCFVLLNTFVFFFQPLWLCFGGPWVFWNWPFVINRGSPPCCWWMVVE